MRAILLGTLFRVEVGLVKWFKTLDRSEPVAARCPLCGAVVPILFLRIEQPHWWKRRVVVTVEGDATDWVAHIWSHRERIDARM